MTDAMMIPARMVDLLLKAKGDGGTPAKRVDANTSPVHAYNAGHDRGRRDLSGVVLASLQPLPAYPATAHKLIDAAWMLHRHLLPMKNGRFEAHPSLVETLGKAIEAYHADGTPETTETPEKTVVRLDVKGRGFVREGESWILQRLPTGLSEYRILHKDVRRIYYSGGGWKRGPAAGDAE